MKLNFKNKKLSFSFANNFFFYFNSFNKCLKADYYTKLPLERMINAGMKAMLSFHDDPLFLVVAFEHFLCFVLNEPINEQH